jgi:hypothetical protein
VRERDDRADQHFGAVVNVQAADETPIDLELVNGQRA